MRITRLSRTKNGLRVNIEIDKEFRLAVEENTLTKNNLYVGKELEEADLELIEKKDIREFGYRIALKYLERRIRSEKEIRDYLFKKIKAEDDRQNDIKNESIDWVVEKLKEQKYLDDTEFAKFVVKSKLTKQNKSRKELVQNLIKYGISKYIYEDVLEVEFDKGKEEQAIRKLIEKKLNESKIANLGKREKQQKLYEYLMRKGFGWDEISKIVKEILIK